MILFSNCKINLGLHILSRREDGYHNIETVFYPVRGLCDAIEIIPSDQDGVIFSDSGLKMDCPLEKNLCVKAYNIMCRDYPVGGVRLHLHKNIPMGAGLGGGSANAAYVIRGLSELFALGLCDTTMERLAAEIGSDTSFFIKGSPAVASGRGEILLPCDISLRGHRLVIVKPEVSVGTLQAYAGVVPAQRDVRVADILCRPVETWRENLVNDFENSVFAMHPILAELKAEMYRQGALYAAMSGSGSAIFGIFEVDREVDLDLFSDLFVYQELI